MAQATQKGLVDPRKRIMWARLGAIRVLLEHWPNDVASRSEDENAAFKYLIKERDELIKVLEA